MKLSEPQARVLRTMHKHDCIVKAWRPGGDGWYVGDAPIPSVSRPRWNTLDSLFWYRALISRESDEDYFTYRLTPKGRDLAKELQDAQD